MESGASFRLADRDWGLVVGWFVALNILDLGLTLHLISQGAEEMNPIMAILLDTGWEWAALYKMSLTLLVATGLWFGRAHRIVRRAGVAFVALFVAITLYQVLDVWVAAV